MLKKLIKSRVIILITFVLVAMFIGILFISNKEQKMTSTIYDININNTEGSLVTKNIVDIKPIEKAEEVDLNENVESNEIDKNKKSKIVILNTPLISEENTTENNKSIEIKKEEKTVKYEKNEFAISKMKSIIIIILVRQGHFNDINIEVNQNIFEEEKEYISLDDINETMFTNLEGNKIKIYAVDEYINDEFIRTRCYVEIE